MHKKSGKLSPSMMCVDFLDIGGSIKEFERLNIEYLHVDIMDGSFVPNYTLGCDFVKNLKKVTKIPLDIHLMIDKPEDKLDWFCFGEGDYVSFHYEATNHVHRVIQRIKDRTAKAMLALNPATPLCVLEDIITDLDGVLIMTVNPGYAGQVIVPGTIEKIRKLREMYPETEIEADGNVSFENAVKMRKAGTDIFVGGSSSIFHVDNSIEQNVKKIRKCIE